MELVDGTVYKYSPVPGNIVDVFPSLVFHQANLHILQAFTSRMTMSINSLKWWIVRLTIHHNFNFFDKYLMTFVCVFKIKQFYLFLLIKYSYFHGLSHFLPLTCTRSQNFFSRFGILCSRFGMHKIPICLQYHSMGLGSLGLLLGTRHLSLKKIKVNYFSKFLKNNYVH